MSVVDQPTSLSLETFSMVTGDVELITDVVDFARSPLMQGILANPTTNP